MQRLRIQVLLDDTALAPNVRGALEQLEAEVDELRRRDEALQKDVRCIADELRLAGTVQRDLLPSALPQVEGVKIHTLYRPAGVVSGDMYDVIRLDDSLVAVSLIDATGHGLAAALLCAYVKRSFGGGGNMDGVGRSLEPDELLTRLNREVLDTQLRECQFIAALYALYDEQTRTVRWSRGGMPYPILVRGREQPRRVPSSGPIIGASPDADFEIVELQLEPGDTLLFHSDGLDSVLVGRSGELGCCDLDRTEWFKALARRPIKQSLADVDYHLSSAERPEWEADDTTIVVLDAAGSKRSVGLDTHAAKQVPALCGSTS